MLFVLSYKRTKREPSPTQKSPSYVIHLYNKASLLIRLNARYSFLGALNCPFDYGCYSSAVGIVPFTIAPFSEGTVTCISLPCSCG